MTQLGDKRFRQLRTRWIQHQQWLVSSGGPARLKGAAGPRGGQAQGTSISVRHIYYFFFCWNSNKLSCLLCLAGAWGTKSTVVTFHFLVKINYCVGSIIIFPDSSWPILCLETVPRFYLEIIYITEMNRKVPIWMWIFEILLVMI